MHVLLTTVLFAVSQYPLDGLVQTHGVEYLMLPEDAPEGQVPVVSCEVGVQVHVFEIVVVDVVLAGQVLTKR